MRLATATLVLLISLGLILGSCGRSAVIAAQHLHCVTASGGLPPRFALRPSLAPPVMVGRQAVTVARRAGAVIRTPYSVRYGLWTAPDREALDVWEIRESHLATYDPGGPNALSCAAHRVYHHFLILVSDQGSAFLEASPY